MLFILSSIYIYSSYVVSNLKQILQKVQITNTYIYSTVLFPQALYLHNCRRSIYSPSTPFIALFSPFIALTHPPLPPLTVHRPHSPSLTLTHPPHSHSPSSHPSLSSLHLPFPLPPSITLPSLLFLPPCIPPP